MSSRRSDGTRPELVYLNGQLLLETTARHPDRDYHWTDDGAETPELAGELNEGDVLTIISEPRQGSDLTSYAWTGTRWVDPARRIAEVLEELPGVERVELLWGNVARGELDVLEGVVARTAEELDDDSVAAVADDVERELRALWGSFAEVLVVRLGPQGDALEAAWRLGGLDGVGMVDCKG